MGQTLGRVTSEDIGTKSGGLKNLKLTFICLNSPPFICLLSMSHSGYLKSIDIAKISYRVKLLGPKMIASARVGNLKSINIFYCLLTLPGDSPWWPEARMSL